MKKPTTAMIVAMLAVACVALAACGGSGNKGAAPSADSQYVGVWKATQGEFKGEIVSADELLEGGVYILDLREDGTAVVTETQEATGTWTENSKGVHVTAGETDADFIAENDYLYFEIFGFKLMFEKQ